MATFAIFVSVCMPYQRKTIFIVTGKNIIDTSTFTLFDNNSIFMKPGCSYYHKQKENFQGLKNVVMQNS